MNPAGRLLNIYNQLFAVPRTSGDQSMLHVWAKVFEVKETADREDQVVACLMAVRDELSLLQTRLQQIGVTERMLHPGFTRFRNITSTGQLNAGWNGLVDEATRPENRIPFAWADWALGDGGEDEMPPDELTSLLAELESLEETLRGTEMSPYMRGFIERQVNLIKHALRLYPIRGVKTIEEAARAVRGSCEFEGPVIAKEYQKAEQPAKSIFEKAGTFIEKSAKVADNLDKIRKAGEGAYSIAASVGPALIAWATKGPSP